MGASLGYWAVTGPLLGRYWALGLTEPPEADEAFAVWQIH
jgi:hypothetical protein